MLRLFNLVFLIVLLANNQLFYSVTSKEIVDIKEKSFLEMKIKEDSNCFNSLSEFEKTLKDIINSFLSFNLESIDEKLNNFIDDGKLIYSECIKEKCEDIRSTLNDLNNIIELNKSNNKSEILNKIKQLIQSVNNSITKCAIGK